MSKMLKITIISSHKWSIVIILYHSVYRAIRRTVLILWLTHFVMILFIYTKKCSVNPAVTKSVLQYDEVLGVGWITPVFNVKVDAFYIFHLILFSELYLATGYWQHLLCVLFYFLGLLCRSSDIISAFIDGRHDCVRCFMVKLCLCPPEGGALCSFFW